MWQNDKCLICLKTNQKRLWKWVSYTKKPGALHTKGMEWIGYVECEYWK